MRPLRTPEMEENWRKLHLLELKVRMIKHIADNFDSDPPELKAVWPL